MEEEGDVVEVAVEVVVEVEEVSLGRSSSLAAFRFSSMNDGEGNIMIRTVDGKIVQLAAFCERRQVFSVVSISNSPLELWEEIIFYHYSSDNEY